MCTKNHDHMMYILPEISSFYTSVPKSWSYDHGHCTKNPDQMMYGSWDMVPKDGHTDRGKKWHVDVGAPTKNLLSKGVC